jgi:hypothetical protein
MVINGWSGHTNNAPNCAVLIDLESVAYYVPATNFVAEYKSVLGRFLEVPPNDHP